MLICKAVFARLSRVTRSEGGGVANAAATTCIGRVHYIPKICTPHAEEEALNQIQEEDAGGESKP